MTVRDRDGLKATQGQGGTRPPTSTWQRILRALDLRRLRRGKRQSTPDDDEPLGYC